MLQNLEQFDLQPRRWQSVIVEFLRQLMLDNLLQYDDEASGKISILFRVFFRFIKVQVERGCHHTRLSVTQPLLQFLLKFRDFVPRGNFDFLQHQNGFLSHKIRSMAEQLDHMLAHSRGDSRVHDISERSQADNDLVHVSVS